MKVLKQESREDELIGIALAAVRSFSRWRKTKLGELWNSSSLAINWGQYWVAGYLTTLRSLRWLQFIERNSGGRELQWWGAAVGGGGVYWRAWLVANPVASTPVINGELKQDAVMRWKCQDTRHKAGRRRSPACISESTTASSVRWPEYFTGRSLSTEGSSAVRSLKLIFFSTVQCQTPFSWTDSLICRAETSRFCAVTWSSPVSKIIALRSSYNIVIAILSKFLLDHAWILVQSYCSWIVSLKFRLQQRDSPSLGIIFSKSFSTTMLTLLSKVVHLW
jgi:hypothetical protein